MRTNVSFMLSSECDFVRRSKTSIALETHGRDAICITEINSNEETEIHFPKGKCIIIEAERINDSYITLCFFEADNPNENVAEDTNKCTKMFLKSTLNNPVVISIIPQYFCIDVDIEIYE